MERTFWQRCVDQLEGELSDKEFDTCIRPLQARRKHDQVELLAPNRYVRDLVDTHYLPRINELLNQRHAPGEPLAAKVGVGEFDPDEPRSPVRANGTRKKKKRTNRHLEKLRAGKQALNDDFTFDAFVEGKSNELAKAAALQVAVQSGRSYNPLCIYGGTGLGKTHLMQAVGNHVKASSPQARVVYVGSEGFVQDMVDALRNGTMHKFGEFYRSVETLLIDDIQFIAGKVRTQEEFFHIFNDLLQRGHQMVFTCDCYPREVSQLEERLKSRFVWGLTVEVEPPELETRVAILMKKAEAENMRLDSEVAFFIAERIRSNVRELEGALTRVIANARFTGSAISINQVKSALRDLFAIQSRQFSIKGIQQTVAEHYDIKISDMSSACRKRNIARPRQMAMFLAKELTSHSLPEIGEAFGGKDHTTVLHACRKIKQLMDEGAADLEEDHRILIRRLSS